MNTQPIIYEHPLNERIRTLLRLEHLFKQAMHFQEGSSLWDSRITISSLFEILELFSRSDLKTEIIKETDRANTNLNALMKNPAVDSQQLSTILNALQRTSRNLHKVSGQLGLKLREDELLASIRQRNTLAGGGCDFDLPGYHHWLEQSAELRQTRQQIWLQELAPIQQAVELLLKLNRDSAEPQPFIAKAGQYQQQLGNSYPYQMIRVFLPHLSSVYPEVSGSKHMFTIRFIHADVENSSGAKKRQIGDDIPFHLALCLL